HFSASTGRMRASKNSTFSLDCWAQAATLAANHSPTVLRAGIRTHLLTLLSILNANGKLNGLGGFARRPGFCSFSFFLFRGLLMIQRGPDRQVPGSREEKTFFSGMGIACHEKIFVDMILLSIFVSQKKHFSPRSPRTAKKSASVDVGHFLVTQFV